MIPRWKLAASLVIALAALPCGAMGAGLLTMEEAEKLSQETGRPILAMAGTKT